MAKAKARKIKRTRKPARKGGVARKALGAVSPWVPVVSVLGGLGIAGYRAAAEKKATTMLGGVYPTQAARRATLGFDFGGLLTALVPAVTTIGLALYTQSAQKKAAEKMASDAKKAQAAADAQAAAAQEEAYKIASEQAIAAEKVKIGQWAKVMQYGTLGIFIVGGGVLAWFVSKGLKKQEVK